MDLGNLLKEDFEEEKVELDNGSNETRGSEDLGIEVLSQSLRDLRVSVDLLNADIREIFRARLPITMTQVPEIPCLIILLRSFLHQDTQTLQASIRGLPIKFQIPISIELSGSKGVLEEGDVQQVENLLTRLEDRYRLQQFTFESMSREVGKMAPNLKSLLDPDIASELLVKSGGLRTLSLMPACNILSCVWVRQNERLSERLGVFGKHRDLEGVDLADQPKYAKLLALATSKASKVDFARESPEGDLGRVFREDVKAKFLKSLEEKEGKMRNPIKAPEAFARKHRGGRKFRRMKGKTEETELMTLQNKMRFGVLQTSETLVSKEDFGLLTQKGNNLLRVNLTQASSRIAKS